MPDKQKKVPKLKILMVAAEVAPYASVGGISRVIPQLAKALIAKGHDVRVFMPKFGSIDEEKYSLEMEISNLEVPTGSEENKFLICNKVYKY